MQLITPVTALKARLRPLLPRPIYKAGKTLRQKIEGYGADLESLYLRLKLLGASLPLPDMLLHYGGQPGDDLFCTAILRELRARHPLRCICMISDFPEIFDHQNDVSYVLPSGGRYDVLAKNWRRYYRHLGLGYDGVDQSDVPRRHIIAELCAQVGIAGPLALRPNLTLTEEEKLWGRRASGRIVIQSSGMGARHPMLNKQWYPERFQAVVEALRREYAFIQLGSAGDPLLTYAEDLRGKTTIRQSAALLYNARMYVGAVGFLMHLARAVDCPSVIVFGGREAPWQSGYICNVNLYTPTPCAPCWKWNRCDFDRQCMKQISADDVVRGVQELAGRPRGPLPVETAYLADAGLALD